MSNLIYLVDLDSTDDEIDRHVNALVKIDIDLKDNARILETQRAIDKIGYIFSAQETKRKDLELIFETTQAKVSSTENKLYGGSIRNPKELEDLQLELNSLKERQSSEEDLYLSAMEQAEDTGRKLSKLEEMLKNLEETWDQDQIRLNKQKDETNTSLGELRNKRETISMNIDHPSLSLYARVRNQRNGTAVARVERGMCQGCNITLPTKTVQLAKNQDRPMQCPSCSRLLYITG